MPASELVRCRRCGLSFRYPAPTLDELTALYQRNKNAHWDYDAAVREDWRNGRERVLAEGDEGRVLDIGCWDGGFLATLPAAWVKYGVEIHPEAARLAADRGISMIASTLYQIEGHDGMFDVVAAFDVAEHVHSPAELVDEMLRLAKPGGLVLVGTGDADAPSWRLMGSRYYYCTTGEHIAFISRHWCDWFAKDRRVGLEAERFGFLTAPRHAASIWLKQTAANVLYCAAPWIFRRLRAAGIGKLDVSQDEVATGHAA